MPRFSGVETLLRDSRLAIAPSGDETQPLDLLSGSTVAFVGRLNDGRWPNPGDTPPPVVEGSVVGLCTSTFAVSSAND